MFPAPERHIGYTPSTQTKAVHSFVDGPKDSFVAMKVASLGFVHISVFSRKMGRKARGLPRPCRQARRILILIYEMRVHAHSLVPGEILDVLLPHQGSVQKQERLEPLARFDDHQLHCPLQLPKVACGSIY
jgi:hypothetical protein